MGICMPRSGVVLALAVAGAVMGVAPAQAIELDTILPAALDQPQINALVILDGNTLPQMTLSEIFDFETGEFVSSNIFNISAYFDTGASGILLSNPTAAQFGIPTVPGVIYADVGVAGTEDFAVSSNITMMLTHFYQRTDLDQFADVAQTIPITSMYTPLPANNPLRAQVGPYNPLVENPILDELELLLGELSAVDVIGMPAIRGQVIVIDPKPVNNFLALFELDIGDIGEDFEIPDVFMRTFIHAPGTPFNPATVDTNPGIPSTSHHVKVTYGAFDRFTSVTPTGSVGPSLEGNPFIGADPVAVLEGTVPADANPGIKITRNVSTELSLSSEGNWLLDTGAAASMISRAQAEALGVFYADGTYKSDNPLLVDSEGNPILGQFQLTIGGVGGQFTAAGFFLDEVLLRTMEGDAGDDGDPDHIKFLNAGVLVTDITLVDPLTGEELTLDGIFGMNFLTASVDLVQGDLFPEITGFTGGHFNWITFDETTGILGLDVAGAAVPEPASLGLLGVGALALLMRRRR